MPIKDMVDQCWQGKSQGIIKFLCWNCGYKGHIKKDCTKPKKNKNLRAHEDTDFTDFVNSAEDIGEALNLNVDNPIEFWILD